MTDFAFPAITPTTNALTWLDNTVVFRSPLSGTIRTETRSGGRWSLSMTFANIKELPGADTDLKVIEAYLYKLNGAANRAVIKDFSYTRSGPGGGTPRVKGASQTGLTLITDGWPVSTTVLYAGDRIGISDQMIHITTDATTDGTGNVTLQLAHPIRVAPSDNALIEITEPTARFILSNKAGFSAAPGIFKTGLAEFEESIL